MLKYLAIISLAVTSAGILHAQVQLPDLYIYNYAMAHRDPFISAAASAAAQRPKQIGVLVVARVYDTPRSGDDGRADQVVERESVEPDEMSDPAAEREAGNAVSPERIRPEWQGHVGGTRDRCPPRATRRRTIPAVRIRIDHDIAHQPQVDDATAVTDAVTSTIRN